MNCTKLTKYLLIVGLVFGGFTIMNSFLNNMDRSHAESYEEKKITIQQIEESDPLQFLSSNGKYNKSFWGTELKISGNVTNKATVASYKDVVIRVTYFSKTKSVIANKEYTIYEVFPPNSTKSFNLGIKNYKDVKSIGWEVVGALSY